MHISLTSPPLILVVMLYHSHEFCSQGILHGRAVHHRHVTLELAAEQAAIGESPRFREDDVPWLWQETHILPCPFNPFNPVVQVPRRFVPIDKVPLCQYAGRIYQFRPVMTDNITELELIFTIDNIFFGQTSLHVIHFLSSSSSIALSHMLKSVTMLPGLVQSLRSIIQRIRKTLSNNSFGTLRSERFLSTKLILRNCPFWKVRHVF